MSIGHSRLEFFPVNGVFGRFGRGLAGVPVGFVGALLISLALAEHDVPLVLRLIAGAIFVAFFIGLACRDVSSVSIEDGDVIFSLPLSDWRIPKRDLRHIGFCNSAISNGCNFWVRVTGKRSVFLYATPTNLTAAEVRDWVSKNLTDDALGLGDSVAG